MLKVFVFKEDGETVSSIWDRGFIDYELRQYCLDIRAECMTRYKIKVTHDTPAQSQFLLFYSMKG